MAGMKGRSGGARVGAGRKPKPPVMLDIGSDFSDPEKFLQAVMNDSRVEAALRLEAAKILMPFAHPKIRWREEP